MKVLIHDRRVTQQHACQFGGNLRLGDLRVYQRLATGHGRKERAGFRGDRAGRTACYVKRFGQRSRERAAMRGQRQTAGSNQRVGPAVEFRNSSRCQQHALVRKSRRVTRHRRYRAVVAENGQGLLGVRCAALGETAAGNRGPQRLVNCCAIGRRERRRAAETGPGQNRVQFRISGI